MSGDGSELAVWKDKMKKKIGRLMYQRELHEGAGAMKNIENEIFLTHIKLIAASLLLPCSLQYARGGHA